jgi:hypothetical protein
MFYKILWGYKTKERPPPDPNDPVWQAIVEMRRRRIEAGQKAFENGEHYRDPYEDRFRSPPSV